MSVILRTRKNADGTSSLRLDIYHNGKRSIETLKHLKLAKVSNPSDRQENKELLRQAEAIRLARAVELEGNNYDIESDAGKKTIITVWMKTYIDVYEKKDKRNMEGVYNRFKKFLTNSCRNELTFGELSPLIIEEFMDFLQSKSKGEGASSYYSRFKKMITNAYRKKFLRENVFDFVEKKIKGRAKKRDILILEELKKLASTPIESSEVRRAFLFSCVTGLAWIDIKKLTWNSIKPDSKIMEIIRSKQEDYNNVVTIPLNSTAINLLGKQGNKTQLVFKLPTANGANKTLKAWLKRAEIDKKISWHNARHSYGTNLIYNEVDVYTTSKLLGHQSLKHTQRYVAAAEELLRKGTDKINIDL